MILTRDVLLKEIKKGNVKITPFDEKDVGPGSIDLSLSHELRVFIKSKKAIPLDKDTNYKEYTKLIDITKGYTLKPKELVMGITVEHVTLPQNICGWINSRSRFARMGLMSHITAPFIAPGASARTVLEIYNAGPLPLKLNPGIKICQLVLQRTEGKATYKGSFVDQEL